MLKPLIEGKALNILVRKRVIRTMGRDSVAWATLQVIADVKDDVNREEANETCDEQLVKHLDEPVNGAFSASASKVDFPERNFLPDAGMTTATSFRQVVWVNG
jgi:hypothetical protein